MKMFQSQSLWMWQECSHALQMCWTVSKMHQVLLSQVSSLAHIPMGNWKISDDLKEAALWMKACAYSDPEILSIVKFSASTLACAVRHKNLTGSVTRARAIGCGWPRLLTSGDSQYLLSVAHHKPGLFLDEYQLKLSDHRHLDVSLATLHWTFARAGLNVKQVQKLAQERDPVLHADFVCWISHYPTNYLVCMDEVSKDNQTYARLWGQAWRGMRVEQHNPFVHKKRYSMVAALVLDEGIVAAKVWEGSFTTDTFLEYLWDDVVSVIHSINMYTILIRLSYLATYDESLPCTSKCCSDGQCKSSS